MICPMCETATPHLLGEDSADGEENVGGHCVPGGKVRQLRHVQTLINGAGQNKRARIFVPQPRRR